MYVCYQKTVDRLRGELQAKSDGKERNRQQAAIQQSLHDPMWAWLRALPYAEMASDSDYLKPKEEYMTTDTIVDQVSCLVEEIWLMLSKRNK